MNQANELFDQWWYDTGSGMAPKDGEDKETHTQRVAYAAAMNAYLCAFNLISLLGAEVTKGLDDAGN